MALRRAVRRLLRDPDLLRFAGSPPPCYGRAFGRWRRRKLCRIPPLQAHIGRGPGPLSRPRAVAAERLWPARRALSQDGLGAARVPGKEHVTEPRPIASRRILPRNLLLPSRAQEAAAQRRRPAPGGRV